MPPLGSSPGLRDAVRQLRRGLRDVKDRMARRRNRWRDVDFAGMAGGDHEVMVLISPSQAHHFAASPSGQRHQPCGSDR
jgi:hypothetical protein